MIGYIFILDRGFRDALELLGDGGFTLTSPHTFQNLLIYFLPTMLLHRFRSWSLLHDSQNCLHDLLTMTEGDIQLNER